MATLQVPTQIDLISTKCISFSVGAVTFKFSADDLIRIMGIDVIPRLTEEELPNRALNVPNMQKF